MLNLSNYSYTESMVKPEYRKKAIDGCVRRLRKFKGDFETIALRGMSGALIAPIVADKLEKNLLVVRKGKERSHSYSSIEGFLGGPYIILDDFADTGRTINTIIRNINREYERQINLYPNRQLSKPELIGVVFYQDVLGSYNLHKEYCEKIYIKLKKKNKSLKWVSSINNIYKGN